MMTRILFLSFTGIGILGLALNGLYKLFFKKKIINEIVAIISLVFIFIGLAGIKFFL